LQCVAGVVDSGYAHIALIRLGAGVGSAMYCGQNKRPSLDRPPGPAGRPDETNLAVFGIQLGCFQKKSNNFAFSALQFFKYHLNVLKTK
jgi:hypothetical protein